MFNNFYPLLSRSRRKRWYFASLMATAIALVLFGANAQAVWGQADFFSFNWLGRSLNSPVNANSNLASIDHAVVRLDGYKLFVIAAPASNQRFPLEQRVQSIEDELNRVVNSKFDPETLPIRIAIDQQSQQPVITIGDRYLMTVTNIDAQVQGREAEGWANQIGQILREALIRAKQERQPQFLINRGLITFGIVLITLALLRLITYGQRRLKSQLEPQLEPQSNSQQESAKSPTTPLAQIDSVLSPDRDPAIDPETALETEVSQLQQRINQKQTANILDLQRRILEIAYIGTLGISTFIILGLFPYSRWLQAFLLSTPLQIVAIALVTYLLIRISHLLIERSTGFLKAKDFAMLQSYQRLDLRLSTISQVLRNITAIVLVGFGILTILSRLGFDLVPLLAGAGIVGIAISFAAQGLIKDVINGFLIILEDQYAVGDVIVVGELGGLVENMNLRVTQVRNNEGQLITIPNSAISVVQNLSKDWARVDLDIRVAYDTDPDYVLEVLRTLAQAIYQEPVWRAKIVESPEVLGIDDLQHSGMLIRIWIKTQPLQQWAVAREFRRRIKLVMAQENIAIGVPQQVVIAEKYPFQN